MSDSLWNSFEIRIFEGAISTRASSTGLSGRELKGRPYRETSAIWLQLPQQYFIPDVLPALPKYQSKLKAPGNSMRAGAASDLHEVHRDH